MLTEHLVRHAHWEAWAQSTLRLVKAVAQCCHGQCWEPELVTSPWPLCVSGWLPGQTNGSALLAGLQCCASRVPCGEYMAEVWLPCQGVLLSLQILSLLPWTIVVLLPESFWFDCLSHYFSLVCIFSTRDASIPTSSCYFLRVSSKRPQLPGPSQAVLFQSPSVFYVVSQVFHSHESSCLSVRRRLFRMTLSKSPAVLVSSAALPEQPPSTLHAAKSLPAVCLLLMCNHTLDFSFLYLQKSNGMLQNKLTNSCPISFLTESRKGPSWLLYSVF